MEKTRRVAKINYQCDFCGRSDVKLWKPYSLEEPLICAECAERRQSKLNYVVRDENNKAQGKSILPSWTVDNKGKVSAYNGTSEKVDNLIIDMKDVGGSFRQTVFPAVVDNENTVFYEYHSIPKDAYQKWEELPTR